VIGVYRLPSVASAPGRVSFAGIQTA